MTSCSRFLAYVGYVVERYVGGHVGMCASKLGIPLPQLKKIVLALSKVIIALALSKARIKLALRKLS